MSLTSASNLQNKGKSLHLPLYFFTCHLVTIFTALNSLCMYVCVCVCVCVCELVSHVQLFVISWTVASPGCFFHGIRQARVLEWIAISFSRGTSQLRAQTLICCIAGRFFYCLRHQGSTSTLS